MAKHNLMYYYDDPQPLAAFLHQVWDKHWITIVVAVLDFIVILYSIVGIMRVGFHNAAGLFGIGVFVMFCLSCMVIRENCGEELYNWLIRPVSECINNNWKNLQW